MWEYKKPEDRTSESSLRFGLNEGFLKEFIYNPNAGKDGSAGEAIDVTFEINGREIKRRFFPPQKVFKDGQEIDKNHPEYQERLQKELDLFKETVIHIAEAVAGEELVKKALNRPIKSFKQFAQLLEKAVKKTKDWNKKPLHIFLQYQWQPTGDNTRTFLEIPKTTKQGLFVTPKLEGNWKLDENSNGIKYINEKGEIHPIKRTAWFKASNFANPINFENKVTEEDWENKWEASYGESEAEVGDDFDIDDL